MTGIAAVEHLVLLLVGLYFLEQMGPWFTIGGGLVLLCFPVASLILSGLLFLCLRQEMGSSRPALVWAAAAAAAWPWTECIFILATSYQNSGLVMGLVFPYAAPAVLVAWGAGGAGRTRR